MASNITPQRRKELENFLKEHPIDHSYDKECEMFDGNPPHDQLLARAYRQILDENPE